jgi:hypothetical protein
MKSTNPIINPQKIPVFEIFCETGFFQPREICPRVFSNPTTAWLLPLARARGGGDEGGAALVRAGGCLRVSITHGSQIHATENLA